MISIWRGKTSTSRREPSTQMISPSVCAGSGPSWAVMLIFAARPVFICGLGGLVTSGEMRDHLDHLERAHLLGDAQVKDAIIG